MLISVIIEYELVDSEGIHISYLFNFKMSTGDIKNNLDKLKVQLRAFKYTAVNDHQ